MHNQFLMKPSETRRTLRALRKAQPESKFEVRKVYGEGGKLVGEFIVEQRPIKFIGKVFHGSGTRMRDDDDIMRREIRHGRPVGFFQHSAPGKSVPRRFSA